MITYEQEGPRYRTCVCLRLPARTDSDRLDAEPEPLRVLSVPRKLGSKYSLLNLSIKAGDTRPGILRSHNHSCSSLSNQSQIRDASFHTLWFESSSSHSSLSAKAHNGVIQVLCLERSLSPPRRVVHKASSTSILIIKIDKSKEEEGGREGLLVPEPASALACCKGFRGYLRRG
jgi:hypothetical protein